MFLEARYLCIFKCKHIDSRQVADDPALFCRTCIKYECTNVLSSLEVFQRYVLLPFLPRLLPRFHHPQLNIAVTIDISDSDKKTPGSLIGRTLNDDEVGTSEAPVVSLLRSAFLEPIQFLRNRLHLWIMLPK